jgi:hypothetical protein
MSYIAVFHCHGGVVMCADTQETVGAYKNYVEKISIIQDQSYPLAVGGAGFGDFIDVLTDEIVERTRSLKPKTKEELKAVLKGALAEVYEKDFKTLVVEKQHKMRPPVHSCLPAVDKRTKLTPAVAPRHSAGEDIPPRSASQTATTFSGSAPRGDGLPDWPGIWATAFCGQHDWFRAWHFTLLSPVIYLADADLLTEGEPFGQITPDAAGFRRRNGPSDHAVRQSQPNLSNPPVGTAGAQRRAANIRGP